MQTTDKSQDARYQELALTIADLKDRLTCLESKAAFVRGFNRQCKRQRVEIYHGQIWVRRNDPQRWQWTVRRIMKTEDGDVRIQLQRAALLKVLLEETLLKNYFPA